MFDPGDRQIAAGMPREVQHRRDDFARKRRVERAELALDLGDQRLFQIDAQRLLVVHDDEIAATGRAWRACRR